MDRNIMCPRSLRYLIAVAEHKSFTRAAEALYVSQPTLSQQIKHLEEELGVMLLDRTGRNVRLTDSGEVYLNYARRALNELDSGKRALHELQDLSRGTLRLGWTPITDYLTCSLLENFNSLFPEIHVSTLEMSQDDIEAAVSENHIDVGIVFSKHLLNNTRTSEINTYKLFEETLCVAVGNKHPKGKPKQRMSATELGRESLVLLNPSFALRRHVQKYFKDKGISPNIAINTNSLNVIIELIQMTPLATVMPNSIVRTQCGIYSIKLQPELPGHAISLIVRKTGYVSPACKAFLELSSEWAVTRDKETPIRRLRPCPLSEGYYEGENRDTISLSE